MSQIKNSGELRMAIQNLERKDTLLKQELIFSYHSAVDSIKPSNMIKSALHRIVPDNGFGSVLKTAGSLGLSMIGGKLTGGGALLSGNNIAGSLAKMVATKSIVNNTSNISAYGKAIYRNLFKKKAK